MLNPYTEHEVPLPYQEAVPEKTQGANQPIQEDGGHTSNQHIPEAMPQYTAVVPIDSKRSSGKVRTGAILALTLLLALVFGVGLFAGWQFGRTSTLTNG